MLDVKLNKKYRDGHGETVIIYKKDVDKMFPWRGDQGWNYTSSGKYDGMSCDPINDLVEEIGDATFQDKVDSELITIVAESQLPEGIVQVGKVWSNQEYTYTVFVNGESKHPDGDADMVMRALVHYLTGVTYAYNKLKQNDTSLEG